MKRVCVFCGSNAGSSPEYQRATVQLGQALTQKKLGLVYGGASVGLMGTIADTVLKGNGEVIGVIPKTLVDKEVAHKALADLRLVGSMHERKALMEDLSDGFIALPGGFGTLEEFFEIITWGQLGFHKKPAGLLNINGYYNGLLSFLDLSVSESFIRKEHRALVLESNDPEKLLQMMVDYKPPVIEKWIKDREKL